VVKPGQEAQLRSCYWECLELAKKHGLRSVAFCCISTGVFGYPQDEAAHVALVPRHLLLRRTFYRSPAHDRTRTRTRTQPHTHTLAENG
jgi:O-acetyl-ADP-ribose deacetylase (regulator of RNase III)